MLVAFSRFFLCGEAAVARFCSQDGRKRRQGASLHGFSVAFGAPLGGFSVAFRASPLFFGPFLPLRGVSRGPIVVFSASQGRKRCSEAPWRRFLPRNCCSLGSIRRDCFRPSEGESSPPVVRIVASGPRIVALVSAKYHLCVRGPSCSKAFLCRFVANTCGFLVRVHGVR